ncbi:MAG: hypothetical protein PHD01_14020 [Geobacteraceae bacterium]|nr:hypothetical protein [Geobacteraceae bacterium]
MMRGFAFKYCRICGGDITTDAQICPLCSSLQQPDKKFCSTRLIIALAGLGFIGITLLGVMSAHAIQQFVSFRTNTCNAAALENIKTAIVGLDQFFAQNGRFPDTLDQILFRPDDGVTVILTETSDRRKYSLVSFHVQGDKEYLAMSGKMGILYTKRNKPGFGYFEVN